MFSLESFDSQFIHKYDLRWSGMRMPILFAHLCLPASSVPFYFQSFNYELEMVETSFCLCITVNWLVKHFDSTIWCVSEWPNQRRSVQEFLFNVRKINLPCRGCWLHCSLLAWGKCINWESFTKTSIGLEVNLACGRIINRDVTNRNPEEKLLCSHTRQILDPIQ